MHVGIIWALSFSCTSDPNWSLWGEFIPFWVTPAKPFTSKPVHLPLVCLADSTFSTHHLPGGRKITKQKLASNERFYAESPGTATARLADDMEAHIRSLLFYAIRSETFSLPLKHWIMCVLIIYISKIKFSLISKTPLTRLEDINIENSKLLYIFSSYV